MKRILSNLVIFILPALCLAQQGTDGHLLTGQEAVIKHAEVPAYPEIARTAHITGAVTLHVTVNSGIVRDSKPTAPANALLLNAARRNVESWHFSSSTSGSFDTTFSYKLEGPSTLLGENPKVELQLPFTVTITAHPAKATCMDCSPEPGSGR